MRALLLIALALAAGIQFWTVYLLRGRSLTIGRIWRAAHSLFLIVWLGCGLAILIRPDFPLWTLILLMMSSAIEAAAVNYFFGVRGHRLTIGSSDHGLASSLDQGEGR
jgi:hypothetical protein